MANAHNLDNLYAFMLRLPRPGLRRRKHRPDTSPNKRHGGSSTLWGFHPKASVLLRKTRPANGLWAKPGNSQGSSLRSLALTRCGAPVHCALRALIPGAGGPTPFASSCNRLSPKTASPWRNVVCNGRLLISWSRRFHSRPIL